MHNSGENVQFSGQDVQILGINALSQTISVRLGGHAKPFLEKAVEIVGVVKPQLVAYFRNGECWVFQQLASLQT